MRDDPWDLIERLGRQLGVGEEALRKWRVRGVPHRWRLELLDLAPALDRAVFDDPPGSRRTQPEAAA